ncbi:MAG: nucleotidyl transferase AbiEii/AbiGii toxin family protein [Elusimicrobia bacterium]|jgi:predicted nucleotidyltransferase component of viral defense system|nr:nucleotidyl transferase AbiEii/AbiGii toxin family protein [Elusimicrobiota bacterium]
MNNKNIPASVRARLLNIARERNENFMNLLIRFAMERFLYRLSKSKYSDQFVLKGAALFNYWHGEPHRPTLDADFSSKNIIGTEEAENMVRKLCRIDVNNDGLNFLEKTVSSEDIREENEYQGIRVKFKAKLGQAVIPVQIDIGFGDATIPLSKKIKYPTLLEFPAPRLLAYSLESCIAEKVQIIFEKGIINSRMKDYYDIWFLISTFGIDGAKLQKAIEETFKRRKTSILDSIPVGLSEEFINDKQKKAQWKGFLNKIDIKEANMNLENTVMNLRDFIMPVIEGARQEESYNLKWHKDKGWEKE